MGEPSIETLYEQVRAVTPAKADEHPPAVVQVAPQIRVLALRTPTLPPAAHTNVYLVGPPAGQRGPQLVVDPGSPYPDQAAVLEQVLAEDAAAGRPLAMVLLTHHHGDHIGGARAVAERWNVPIAAHANTAKRLADKLEVARVVSDGDNIDGMTAVFTPGHADGHLCFEIGGATIAGDMVAGVGTILIDPSEGDMAEYLRSLERLLARPPAMLLPAHGPAIPDGPGKLREYIAHRTMRENRVLSALLGQSDATPRELLPTAYADTPRPLWPLAERSLRAHLGKLAAEGRAREVSPGRWSAR